MLWNMLKVQKGEDFLYLVLLHNAEATCVQMFQFDKFFTTFLEMVY